MRKFFGYMTLAICVGAMVSLSSCKKTKPRSSGATIAGVGGIDGVGIGGIDGIPLGERPDGGFGMEEAGRGQFEAVYFAYDSSQIQMSERSKLEAVAQFLRQNPSASLIAEGHCDSRGSSEYNLALGERRALAARAYLVGMGIDAGRVQTRSYGEEMPVDPSETEAAYSLNRRSEFVAIQ